MKFNALCRQPLAAPLAAAVICLASLTLSGGGAAAAPELNRGVNLLKPFNLPSRTREGGYKVPPFDSPLAKVSDDEMRRLAAIGLDHVRLTIDPGVFLEAPQAQRADLDADLQAFVKRLQTAGLKVVIDPHPMPGQQAWAPDRILTGLEDEKFRRYRQFVVDLAGFAVSLDPDKVVMGLMNEPQRACVREDGPDWMPFQKNLFDAVRAAAPDLTIAVTTGCFSSLKGLESLDMRDYDANTLVDLHYYDPYLFTHQSPGWTSVPFRFIAGVSYPASSGSALRALDQSRKWQAHMRESGYKGEIDSIKAASTIMDYYVRQRPGPDGIRDEFATIAAWARKNRVDAGRILIGEFGAWRLQSPASDDGSRARWITDVRTIAEDYGFGWTFWEYTSPFGMVADRTREVDPAVAKALGLKAGE